MRGEKSSLSTLRMPRSAFIGVIAAVVLAGAGLAVGLSSEEGNEASDGPHYGAMPCSEWLASDDEEMRREAVRTLLQSERDNEKDSSGEMVARPASAEMVTEFQKHVQYWCEKEIASDPWLTEAASSAFITNKIYFSM